MSELKNEDKQHLSVCIAGTVDSGKSTTTGHLLFKLGVMGERDLEKLKAEAEALGKGSFSYAFFMDKQKEERARGVTIAVTTKEFFTPQFHYTILDLPGHSAFIKNMITGSSQADVAVLMVPADGNFAASIAKANHKKGQRIGQTRQHALLLNLLGVKQLIVCVNKMDCDLAKYGQARFEECRDEAVNMLKSVGWKKDFIEKQVPIIPISGFKGDNLVEASTNMDWWKGNDLTIGDEKVHVRTLLDAFDKVVKPPKRHDDKPLRIPISGVLKIKGVGDVLTGRVEQGVIKPGEEVVFLPSHSAGTPCEGKVFTVEMHHRNQEKACAGDNVGMNIKGLNKSNMPNTGDVMVLKKDTSVGKCQSFVAQVQILHHPGELKPGYTPIGFVRTSRSAIKMTKIDWKVGKETGGQKLEDPPLIKAGEMAQVHFEPQQPFVIDTFKNCEGLGRIAVMEGNTVVMLGKVTKATYA